MLKVRYMSYGKRPTVFCEINAKLRNQSEIPKSVQFATIISNVQLILQNHEISSVCSWDFPCSVDFAKLRNEFSLLSEFPVCSVDFAKSRNQFSLPSEFPVFS